MKKKMLECEGCIPLSIGSTGSVCVAKTLKVDTHQARALEDQQYCCDEGRGRNRWYSGTCKSIVSPEMLKITNGRVT